MQEQKGRFLPEGYEHSIEGQIILMSDEIEKAIWKLEHVQIGKRTKKEMKAEIREVERMLLNVKKRIKGK